MRSSWLVVLLVACAGAQTPPPAPVPAPVPQVSCPSPSPPAKPAPATLTEAEVSEKSKAFYAALDSDDVATFDALAASSFVLFDQARSYTPAYLIGRMRARLERGAPHRTRTWSEERVFVGPNTAIFIGAAVENVPAEGDQKAASWEGWHTLVWVHDGTTWKAAHAQWQVGGIEAERSAWNEAFRKSSGFKRTPNQLLIDTVKGRKPGAALDVAMGQGRNAVYLATKGWKVTGIDISDEGIRIAKDAATKARTRIDAVQVEAEKYDFGKDKWDLVTLIYAGDDAAIIDRIKTGLRKNGLFVVEYFHKDSTTGVGIGGFATGQLAAQFADWKILKDEVVEDVADWSLRKTKLVRFVAQKP